MAPSEQVDLMGVAIDRLDAAATIEHILGALAAGVGGWAVTVNLDILRRLVRDGGFRGLTEGATLRVADGMPLVWASRMLGRPLPERVAGSDLIWSLSAGAAGRDRSVFLLGGNPGAAEGAARVLCERSPGLRIAGTDCPPLGFERDEVYSAGLRQRLAASGADVVFVALGCPKQERFIARVREDLPRAWFLGVGISFSFVTGEVRRAPKLLQRIGLEWVHRMVQEPGRLMRRYLLHDLPFAARLFAWALWRRMRT